MARPGLSAIFATLAAVALCTCGRADQVPQPRAMAQPRSTPEAVATRPPAPVAEARHGQHAAPPWPPAEMQDPDPRMRRFALEKWAREPTESLDLVAAALVDPEESIRQRAEQIFEEALARRR